MLSFAKIVFTFLTLGALVSAAVLPINPILLSSPVFRNVAVNSVSLPDIARNSSYTPDAKLTPAVLGPDMTTILLTLQTNLVTEIQILSTLLRAKYIVRIIKILV